LFKEIARRCQYSLWETLSVTRAIKVRVVDEDGYGVSGIKVNVYDGPVIRTDGNGYAAISCDSSDVSIYVNGFTSYSGSVSGCPGTLIVNKSGQRHG
jgi:hypothetical protein